MSVLEYPVVTPSFGAIDIYELAQAGAETIWESRGTSGLVPLSEWQEAHLPGDEGLLGRCHGRTLDVGCGPGRLVAALATAGVPCLGIDLCPGAVRQAQQRGAPALVRDVFGRIPQAGQWNHVLLADGNIGIGGDPLRLLTRCRSLLGPGGSVLLDLSPPGTGYRTHQVRLRVGEVHGEWFTWAHIDGASLAPMAWAAGLHLDEVWYRSGRWQGELRATTRWPAGQ